MCCHVLLAAAAVWLEGHASRAMQLHCTQLQRLQVAADTVPARGTLYSGIGGQVGRQAHTMGCFLDLASLHWRRRTESPVSRPALLLSNQVDFIRGAAHSRGGLPIIALPSTAAGGTASRILPELGLGGAVVTSRCGPCFC